MFLEFKILLAIKRADPPPATAPYCIAAQVAQNESSSLSASSVHSTSVFPPTFTIAIPLLSYPSLFSISTLSAFWSYIECLMKSCLSFILYLSPFPFMIKVDSFEMIAFMHFPRTSSTLNSL